MNKNIHKIWILIAMLWVSISASGYDFEVEGIQYNIISIGDRTCSVEKITVEAGERVKIQEYVSYNNASFSIIQFESNCTSSTLKDLDIEDCNVSQIVGAFTGAINLESVKLPVSLSTIGANTFSNCKSLKYITIPNGVTTIGHDAFLGCTSLINCLLPSNLKTIDYNAFKNCEALQSISIPPYVESIGNFCFESCKSLSDLVFEGNSDSPTIEIPQIGYYYSDPSYYNIGAFTYCNPSSIEINRAITYKPNGNIAVKFAFEKAPKTLKIGSVPTSIPEYLFRTGTPTDLIISDRTNPLELPQSYDVENLYLGGNVNKTIKTTSVQISDLVTALPTSFFEGSRFSHITLPSSIESIGDACFSNCTNLENIEIPTSLKVIPQFAFSNCNNLKSLVLNEDLDAIQEKAFEGVDLDIIECRSMTPARIGEAAFTNKTYLNATLIVKKDAIDNYKNAEYWRNFFNIKYFTPVTGLSIEPKDVLLEVGNSLSLNVEYLIDDPDGYPLVDFELIWSSGSPEIVLVNDKGVLEASMPGKTIVQAYPSNNASIVGQCSVKVIPEIPNYFEVLGIRYHKLNNLQVEVAHNVYSGDLLIPESVTYSDMMFSVIGIEDDAFNGCSNLNSIQIPGSIQQLANDLFSDIDKLQKLVFESGNAPLIVGYNSKLNLSSSITPFPNPSDVDERRTGFRNGYYDGLFYGLPIEHLVINRDIELPKYYERTMGTPTSSYSTVYNDIVYYPPFYGLTNLKSLEIGDNVSAICKNQIEAVVNAVPTTMEYTNFGKCDNIEVVISNNPNAPIGGGFSQAAYESAYLFLPNGGADSYKSDDYWKNFAHIGESAFVPIESISFESDEVTMDINDSKLLHPLIYPSDASIKTLKWSSSKPSIVNVSEDGVITTSSQVGEAIITVSACDGTGMSSSIKVIVQNSSGISDVSADSRFDISVENGRLYIHGKHDTDTVSIYNVQGQLVISTYDNEIELSTKGIYIIKVGSICEKIIL